MKKLTLRKYFLFIVALMFFFVGYGLLDESENKAANIGRYASAGVQECGCDKCHSIEINGCKGCHNSNNPNKSGVTLDEENVKESLESETAEVVSQDNTDIKPENEPESENTDSVKGNGEKPRRQQNKR